MILSYGKCLIIKGITFFLFKPPNPQPSAGIAIDLIFNSSPVQKLNFYVYFMFSPI